MNIKSYNLKKQRTLHFIENKKMKTVIIWFVYHMPLDENASKNAMLARLLFRGSKGYPTTREIARFLYSNYGATAGTDINLKGEIYTFGMYTNYVSDKFKIVDSGLTRNILSFIKDVLYRPLIRGGKFKKDYFQIEKQNLISMIENKINNKDAYAFDRCVELMCKNEPYGIDKLGKLDWVKSMNNEEVSERYHEIINNMPLNIYVMGNIDQEQIRKDIEDVFELQDGEPIDVIKPIYNKKDVIENIEKMEISQGKLCMGFRTGIDLNHSYFPAYVVMNKLFGGGPQSKLFMNVREKESLCYSIYSTIEKYKGLMFVYCGIDNDKREMTKNRILNILDEIKSGNFSDSDIKDAITSSKHSLESIKDNNFMYISYLHGLNIYNANYDIDELIKSFDKVSKDDVIASCKNIEPDTIYFLGSR
jgi:predicted Zn-dependent peptidase